MSENLKWKLVESPNGQVLTVLVDGELEVLDSSHPNFQKVLDRVRNDIVPDVNLFSLAKAVADKFDSLSERVSVAGGRVFFDGDELDNSLTQHIVRLLESGVNFTPFVRFLEKLFTNPDENSREQLYTWLVARDFTITDDGDFIAYKGVNLTAEEEDGQPVYKSSNSGKAIVNGTLREGQIPQWVGAVVEMPRSEVVNDPRNGCSVGLHAATFSFAQRWTDGTVLALRINPRDVVSVPTESSQEKLRVCRYTVDKLIQVEYTEPVYEDYDDADLDDELGWGDGEDGEWVAGGDFDGSAYDPTPLPTKSQEAGLNALRNLPSVTPVGVSGPNLSFSRSHLTDTTANTTTSDPVNSQAKLNWADVDAIRAGASRGEDLQVLADNYGVSKRAVDRIVKHQSWA